MRMIFKEAEKSWAESEDHEKYEDDEDDENDDEVDNEGDEDHPPPPHPPPHVQRGRRRVGRIRLVLATSHILYQSCTKILCNTYLPDHHHHHHADDDVGDDGQYNHICA